jgi:pimeloyl-ACP methyl ester carboxylesterase
MRPTVRYATTTDGVSIAFSEAGEGPALFYLPSPPLAHAQLAWELYAPYLEDLVSDFRVVYVNSRGCGLSSTDRIDFSLEAMVKDIDAVVVALGLPSIALFGWGDGSPIRDRVCSRPAGAGFPPRPRR